MNPKASERVKKLLSIKSIKVCSREKTKAIFKLRRASKSCSQSGDLFGKSSNFCQIISDVDILERKKLIENFKFFCFKSWSNGPKLGSTTATKTTTVAATLTASTTATTPTTAMTTTTTPATNNGNYFTNIVLMFMYRLTKTRISGSAFYGKLIESWDWN